MTSFFRQIWTATFALALVLAAPAISRAQDPAKSSDDALDSLLEKLSESPGDKTSKPKTDAPKPKSDKPKAKEKQKTEPKPDQPAQPKDASKLKDASKPKPAEKLPTKDQELDDLLEKLGETKDAPTPEDPHQGQGPRQEGKQPQKPGSADKPENSKLGRGDKELDQRLEELTGRKRKKQGEDEERPAAVNDMIKEMRDVEERLTKPDTGDDTRTRQKQIVKRIDTMIEEVRKSRSSMRAMSMRRQRQQGQQKGGQQPQQGEQPGAMAGGVGPQKPQKPTTQHSTANGKDVWGHLPPELRGLMDNVFKETALISKQELIELYYLSVGKGKLVREE
jgi:hypothetical protein